MKFVENLSPNNRGEGAVKAFFSKRRWIAAAGILLLLFLLRPGASRLKSRIIFSISAAVGGPVDIGAVHIRLLPRPGFDLQNLVVYDDPAFGVEPMLRAGDVIATLRLTSLLRGRLEIARLELTEPSLNLVDGNNGRWNLEALLERTAHTPLAPTTKAKSEPRLGFPYIEASAARINFKSGPEKKAYALTNADFSLWQDSENTWGVRLQAQPVRTDLNLNDTGVLRMNGAWQRAATLRDTPLQFSVEWDRPQLGQLTKLFTGRDQGWRGGVVVETTLTGTPAKLLVRSDVAIQDFRRYDITSGQALRLAAHCDGQYSSVDQVFHGMVCSAPVGSGLITLKGDVGLPGTHRYHLSLKLKDVPAIALVAVAQRAKKNLPDDLAAAGMVRGSVAVDVSAGSALRFEGEGEIAAFQLTSAANKVELGPVGVPFVFTSGGAAWRRARLRRKTSAMRFPNGPHVEVGPLSVGMGRTSPATVRGWINRTGYNLAITGERDVAKSLRAARLFGLPAPNAAAEGLAQMDLQIAGTWPGWSYGTRSDFVGPQVTGTAKLRNVRVLLHGTGGPVEMASADLQLGPDKVRVNKISANAAGALWTGSLEVPRACGTPGACEIQFNLKADRIALGEVREWVNPTPKAQPWYRVLESSPPAGPSWLGTLRASGRLAADRVLLHGVTATHASANVGIDRGKLAVLELRAEVLGGTHRGAWDADFSVKPPMCKGSGQVNGVALGRLGGAASELGISGTGNGTYHLSASCTTGFWTSAEGTLEFDLRDGTMTHVSLVVDEGPLQIGRLWGQARFHAGKIEMKDVRLDSASGKFLLSGTASLNEDLELTLARSGNRAAGGYTISGTLTQPQVAPMPGTEARLKADGAK